jgi:hypothetical protein
MQKSIFIVCIEPSMSLIGLAKMKLDIVEYGKLRRLDSVMIHNFLSGFIEFRLAM